jgi:hypothetical protein
MHNNYKKKKKNIRKSQKRTTHKNYTQNKIHANYKKEPRTRITHKKKIHANFKKKKPRNNYKKKKKKKKQTPKNF